LRERGKLHLDDVAGKYVDGLHRDVAATTIAQLLSHSSGIIRDGRDTGQWTNARPFLNAQELRAALAEKPILPANTRFKYSNHAYALAGLVIEAITGERYVNWMQREIVAAAGLPETAPDIALMSSGVLASGHSTRLPLGRRVVIPGDNPTDAMAPATGFVSTAADLARFFAQLDPAAKKSFLAPASRREMIRRQWPEPHGVLRRHYGLGIMSGDVDDWAWYGHGGAFQGFISRTVMVPGRDLSVSILTNAIDGLANPWSEAVLGIFRRYAKHGAPGAAQRDWKGRWWTLWGCLDFVPMGDRVFVGNPGLGDPFIDASEVRVTARDRGRIVLANGYASHGEDVALLRDARGNVTKIHAAGRILRPERDLTRELTSRYAKRRVTPKRPA
jgi:CubicO group peptidase (beta-lactamase class C family)